MFLGKIVIWFNTDKVSSDLNYKMTTLLWTFYPNHNLIPKLKQSASVNVIPKVLLTLTKNQTLTNSCVRSFFICGVVVLYMRSENVSFLLDGCRVWLVPKPTFRIPSGSEVIYLYFALCTACQQLLSPAAIPQFPASKWTGDAQLALFCVFLSWKISIHFAIHGMMIHQDSFILTTRLGWSSADV